MTRALDYFDPAHETNDDLVAAVSRARQVPRDVVHHRLALSAAERSKEIVDALIAARKNVCSAVIESEHGHDSFLLPIARYTAILSAF